MGRPARTRSRPRARLPPGRHEPRRARSGRGRSRAPGRAARSTRARIRRHAAARDPSPHRESRRRSCRRNRSRAPARARARSGRAGCAARAPARAVPLEDALPRRVERLQLDLALEFPTEEREHDGVPLTRRPVGTVENPSQRPLLDEAELARNREARLVGRIYSDLDPLDLAELEADARQRGSGLGAESLTQAIGTDPVADLEDPLAPARVQAGAADRLGLIGREDSVDEVLAEVEPAAEAAQQLDLRLQWLRFLVRPGHPRAQVVERRVDRLLEQRPVAWLPAAHHEALRLNPVRRWRHGRGIYRGVPSQASAGTISTRSPPSTRQSETACSSPASSGATPRGT